MKLLILTQAVDRNDHNLGFFHRWLLEFARNFGSVTVIALRVGSYDLPSNIKVVSLGKEKGVSRLGRIVAFYRYIRKFHDDYDAVFVHMNPEYAILGGIYWRIFKKKSVLWYTHKSVDMKLRLGTLFVDSIATASKESFRLRSSKVHMLGHGIDTDTFRPIESAPHEKTVVSIGRISRSKNYETLINAISHTSGIRLFIIGAPVTDSDKAYMDSLQDLVREKGLESRISYQGSVKNEDVPLALRDADVFVNLSRTGSLDKAVLESMACGVPAITSNEAFKEMLGPFGLMCKEGDEQELARLIEKIFAENRKALGERLREIVVRDHSLPRLVGRIKGLYETSR
jgi:glycosyltransferase involved in cell wall biosynthesis